MFNLCMSLFVAALFYVLTPGILVSLPPKGSKMVVALTHAVVFAVVFALVHKMVMKACSNMRFGMEGFRASIGSPEEHKRKMREKRNEDRMMN